MDKKIVSDLIDYAKSSSNAAAMDLTKNHEKKDVEGYRYALFFAFYFNISFNGSFSGLELVWFQTFRAIEVQSVLHLQFQVGVSYVSPDLCTVAGVVKQCQCGVDGGTHGLILGTVEAFGRR